jgi:hypothetical protein
MKTIVLVWTQKVNNFTTTNDFAFWGLGDMLRGVYGIFQLAEKLGCEFILDYSLHPISQCLCPKNHSYSTLIAENKDNIPFILYDSVESYSKETLTTKDVVYFNATCNLDVFNTPPNAELKQYIQSSLTPNAEFQSYIDDRLSKIPFPSFTIFHYRLGDNELVRNTPDNLESYISHFKGLYKPEIPTILLSDSSTFKEIVHSQLNVFMFHEPIGHIGYHTELAQLMYSLFEFILLTKASSIQTYTIYGYISGFPRIANCIYNIPLVQI